MDTAAKVFVPSCVIDELEAQAANPRTKKERLEVAEALHFLRQENPDRFEITAAYATPAPLKGKGYSPADLEIQHFCNQMQSEGNKVVLYTADNRLAYILTRAYTCVSVRQAGKACSLDYATEVLPEIQQRLQTFAKDYDLVLTAGLIKKKGFKFSVDKLEFATTLNSSGCSVLMYSSSLALLNERQREWLRSKLPDLVELPTPGGENGDELDILLNHLSFCPNKRPFLVLCSQEQAQAYIDARKKQISEWSHQQCWPEGVRGWRAAGMSNGGMIYDTPPWKDKFKTRGECPLASSGGTPTAHVPVRVEKPEKYKSQIARAVKERNVEEVRKLVMDGGNPCWAVIASFRHWGDMLPGLLESLTGKCISTEWFCWVVDVHISKLWREADNQWEGMRRVLPVLLKTMPFCCSLSGCKAQIEKLRKWRSVCSDAMAKALLDQTIAAIAI